MSFIDKYSLREATNKDVTAVKSVIFTVLNEYGLKPDENATDFDLNDIEMNYTNNGGYFGVILHEDQIAGTAGLYRLSDTICELRKMYLAKEHRGRGLGKFLIDNMITIAKEKGYKFIELETASVLKEAIALYKKYGFKEFDKPNLPQRCDKAFILELE